MDKPISRFEYAIREYISDAETKGFRPLTIAEENQNREENIKKQMSRFKVKKSGKKRSA